MDISRENSSMYSNSSYVRHTTSYRQIIIVYNMTMLYNILVTKSDINGSFESMKGKVDGYFQRKMLYVQ